jgi:hypothetical protein
LNLGNIVTQTNIAVPIGVAVGGLGSAAVAQLVGQANFSI